MTILICALFVCLTVSALRQGKTRLAKYYIPMETAEKHKTEQEVHRLIANRDSKMTNFVEYRTYKIIYRRYASLYFSMCVDVTDNELAYLESIHLFVECLDQFFTNVCELDLVWNFHKVYLLLDEFILAGEIQETSKRVGQMGKGATPTCGFDIVYEQRGLTVSWIAGDLGQNQRDRAVIAWARMKMKRRWKGSGFWWKQNGGWITRGRKRCDSCFLVADFFSLGRSQIRLYIVKLLALSSILC